MDLSTVKGKKITPKERKDEGKKIFVCILETAGISWHQAQSC
jgi:hypothetical protein